MTFKSQYNSGFRAVILKSIFISNLRYLQLSTDLVKKRNLKKKKQPKLKNVF